jgi:hypothetical protein
MDMRVFGFGCPLSDLSELEHYYIYIHKTIIKIELNSTVFELLISTGDLHHTT